MAPRNKDWGRVTRVGLLSAGALALGTLPLTLPLLRLTGYHVRPRPDGMRLRVDLPPSQFPHDRPSVRVLAGDEPALEVRGLRGGPHVFSVASGDRLAAVGPPSDPETVAPGAFDFDGDGVEDEIVGAITEGGRSVLRVVCGATGRVLFGNVDPMGYTPTDRGRPLPDLDGDGRSELAVYHPRDDRSTYDFEVVDAVLDVTSWMTVVSYDGR
ncbi:MAG: hypothetical protein AAGB93_18745 [Planctomycetota bacterium]